MMESRQTLIFSAAVLAVLCLSFQVDSVHSQNLPLCRNLRRDFEEEEIRLFRNADGVQSIEDHLCVNNRNRLRRFYSCPKGFTVFIPSRDNGTTLRDFRTILDIRAISRQQGLPSRSVLICIPPRPTTPPPTTPPPTTSAPDEMTDAPVPVLPSCPSSGGATVNEYIRQDQDKLCRFKCSFKVAVFGIPTGERTRTIIRCCEGEPKLVSRALRLYSCPDSGNDTS